MDEYYAQATEYFDTFEGRHLYPGLLSWQWILWAIFGICFVGAICMALWLRTWPWIASIYVAEILFLSMFFAISHYRKKQLNERFSLKKDNRRKHLKMVQKTHLESLTKKTAKDFANIVNEIAELRSHLDRFAPKRINYAKLIYDPSTRIQLIFISLASLALFFAFTVRTSDVELMDLMDFVEAPWLKNYIWLLLLIAIAIFVFACGLYYSYLESKAFIISWLARLIKDKSANELALEYFVTALIEQYDPTPLDKK